MTPIGAATRRLTTLLAAGTLLATALAGCGDSGDDDSASAGQSTTDSAVRYQPIKDYLLDHTEKLQGKATEMRADAERYHAMAKATGFDYEQLLDGNRDQVRAFVEKAQKDFGAANPAYEEMEGVVAGVPELAEYDVIIDAGSDASDPENAVPFNVTTPGGKTYKQPGNINYLIETSVFGTEPKFAAKGVEPDLDGDGKSEFGESVPDADFYVAAAREFERNARALDAAAQKWQPTKEDVFTSLVVMVPTMSEYFEAWKNSRFVAGENSKEKAFVVASRLQDIGDILGGLVLVYDNVAPDVAKADAAQAKQTGRSLKNLHAFVGELERKEEGGRKYTAEEADTLGAEAQQRAEAIAGQVSQAAEQLNIQVEEG